MSIESIFTEATLNGLTSLTEVESKLVLAEAGIPVIETGLARSKAEAVSLSNKLGFPVVMKIISPEIVHKSDVGGVKLNLNSQDDVQKAYDKMMTSVTEKLPRPPIQGVSVQHMASPGTEIIIGMNRDRQFGPVIMFGLGGILTEIIKDVSFRIVPLEGSDAQAMIREIKGYPLLEGYRGSEPVDIPALEEILIKVSDFADRYPQVIELDINPIFAYKSGAIAVDARIILQG